MGVVSEEEPLSVAEQVLDALCRLESPDDLVNFFEAAAALLNRCRRVAGRCAAWQCQPRFEAVITVSGKVMDNWRGGLQLQCSKSERLSTF